jgi:hypothetical protein
LTGGRRDLDSVGRVGDADGHRQIQLDLDLPFRADEGARTLPAGTPSVSLAAKTGSIVSVIWSTGSLEPTAIASKAQTRRNS